jgi:pimeloyl-ACP methyl ester carboxylesterase
LLAIDNRGVGRSARGTGTLIIEQMAADVRSAMDDAGWDRAHVAGHSMGGVIAQQLALDVPERVASLALLCTFAHGRDAARLTPWIAWMGLRTRVGTRQMRRRAFVELVMAPGMLDDIDGTAARLAAVFGRDLADQPAIAMTQVRAMSRHDAGPRLGELSGLPTLVVSAEHDRIAHPAFGEELQQAIRGARYVEIAGSAHACTVDRAEQINALLAEHWTQSAGQPA